MKNNHVEDYKKQYCKFKEVQANVVQSKNLFSKNWREVVKKQIIQSDVDRSWRQVLQ